MLDPERSVETMIEAVFCESAAVSLKIAESYGQGEFQGSSAIGIFVQKPDGSQPTEEELRQAQQELEALERQRWEAATPLGGKASDVYFIQPQGREKEPESLVERYSAGEPLRIWAASEERLSLQWLLDRLKGIDGGPIQLVELPIASNMIDVWQWCHYLNT